jgi:ribosomal protein L11 methyltransferase
MPASLAGAVWRVACIVPKHASNRVAEALEVLGGAVNVFLPEGNANETRVECFLQNEPDPDEIRRVLATAAAMAAIPVPQWDVIWLAPRDWLAENRQAFDPFAIGRYFIHGSDFDGVVPLGGIGLQVDAGLAFGSGRHESTAGCLLALEGLAARRFRRPLDMGCGSGILAIAIAKTWRVRVVAADVDTAAVRVARANAHANGVGPLIRTTVGNGYAAPRVRRHRPYDLIVANILATPLCRMAKKLGHHLKPGGHAVLSGFVIEDGNRVAAAHWAAGLRQVGRVDVSGWRTLVLRKPNRS